MENGQNVSALSTSGSLINPIDQRSGLARTLNDVVIQRLKNRERQRRYRARKRLEADKKSISVTTQPMLLQVETQVIDIPSKHVSRVYSHRNWKRDARKAHICKEQEIKSYAILDFTSTNANQAPSSSSGSKADLNDESHSINYSTVDNIETPRVTPSRRHWKADARNKKN